ncbi:MAG: hypothetical protein IJC02_12095 [Lachnospiraceae bacterium]|nr:hypothetical protein [Lachnospiraceae bacterium]
MLFSVNQGIELYVKSICWSLNILLGYKSQYKTDHDIRGIWFTAKKKIMEFVFDAKAGRGEKEFNQKIKTLEAYLNELTDLLKKGNDKNNAYHDIDFSRYPVNNQNEYHFYVKQYDNVVIDLENFVTVFENISDCLESLASYYYDLVVESWQTE